jgi:hypothetical protein
MTTSQHHNILNILSILNILNKLNKLANMKFTTLIATALPMTALPFAAAASAVWNITDFQAYDIAHTWSSQ